MKQGILKIMGKKNNSGFTLVEVLVVILLIAIVTVILLLLLNPSQQRHKIWDIDRKRELNQLKVLFENYYFEHLEYPTAEQVCYDEPTIDVNGNCNCHICGLVNDPGTFRSLVALLYCDPEHPRRAYLYQYDCNNPFPLRYKLYTRLSDDPTEGTVSGLQCNYGVSNEHTTIEPFPEGCVLEGEGEPGGGGGSGGGGSGGGPTNTPAQPTPTPPPCPDDPVPKYCELGGICNICGNYANCLNPSTCDQPPVLFEDGGCAERCQSFGGFGPTNTPPPTPTPFQLGSCPVDPTPKYCQTGGTCNICGNFQDCLDSPACDDPLVLYGNETCNAICYEE
jgi:prepilin-type N-terminal cleavage/methylation domain-containing protein